MKRRSIASRAAKFPTALYSTSPIFAMPVISMTKRDLILSQIIGGSLNTIADEMSATVTRTARSPVFNEAHDFTTAIFEFDGQKSRLVAQSPGCTLHLYAVVMAVDRAIEAFKYDLQPGDVILASDPYDGGTHIPDVVVIAPVFHDRKPVLFPAVRAHMGDVGGPVAGGYNPHARDIWQDGLVMPPLKIVSRGERRRDAFDLIVGNNRLAHWVQGDLDSMIGACGLASRRISELLDRYSLPTVRKALQSNIDYAEKRVRAEIASWPDGEFAAETFVDHDYAGGKDIRIACKATVKGSDLTLDFTGTAPQVQGFINSPIANTLSFVFLAVAGCRDEDIPINEGYMAPVKVIAPEGTVVNPKRPAPRSPRSCCWPLAASRRSASASIATRTRSPSPSAIMPMGACGCSSISSASPAAPAPPMARMAGASTRR
jgi:N-methylhydantoinase B